MGGFGLLVHILGGGVALFAGAAALSARKGPNWHARFGVAFVVSMLVMASTGAVIAALKPERVSAVTGVLTIYLVASSWLAIRAKEAIAGRYEVVGLLVATGCAVADFIFGMQAAAHPSGRLDGFSAAPYFSFAALAGLAAVLDLKFILRRRLTGSQRLARHLWRMCVALFIAAASFFLGQADVFPQELRSPLLAVPPLAVLAVMAFWLLRLRFPKKFGRVLKTVRRAGAFVQRGPKSATNL